MASSSIPIKQGFADVPEGQIHYRTAGEGPTLLLLHLTTASSDIYADVMPILATRFRVIAMDRFGHGSSDPLPEVVTIEVLTRCVINFMDALGVERTSIVGQSTGCHEAVELAITELNRVEKLVLARITAQIHERPAPGADLIVAGWSLFDDGRKHGAATALFTRDGQLLAQSEQLWIELKAPAA